MFWKKIAPAVVPANAKPYDPCSHCLGPNDTVLCDDLLWGEACIESVLVDKIKATRPVQYAKCRRCCAIYKRLIGPVLSGSGTVVRLGGIVKV